MELLIWHECLGSDDEQASQEELLARVLYSYSSSSISSCSKSSRSDDDTTSTSRESSATDRAVLQSLHFVQGLLTFVRMVRRSKGNSGATLKSEDSDTSAHNKRSTKEVEWMSVTLSRRKFFIQEVEPQIYIALKLSDSSSSKKHPFTDGLELLLVIQAARKRVRKLTISIESCHEDSENQPHDNTRSRLEEDLASAKAELRDLLKLSPITYLKKQCDAFFPTLLHALDVPHASSLHELIGMGDFPLDQLTFLSLQSFVNSFQLELADKVESCAVLYKGNLLWSSIGRSMLQLLYRFLRLREENGMEIEQSTDATLKQNDLWMVDKYRDTFLPIWSSKTSYTECTIVNNARHHPRKDVRSLHKQAPAPLAAVVADVNSYPSSSSGGSSASIDGASATSGGGGCTLSKSGLKARIKSVSYRNTGMLMKNGYFAKNFELPTRSRGRGRFTEHEALEFVWMPPIFPLDGDDECDQEKNADSNSVDGDQPRRTVVWHESDLTLIILVKLESDEATQVQDKDEHASVVLNALSNIEDVIERLQLHELAKLIPAQYQNSSARGASSQRSSTTSSSPPFVYRNRANATFITRFVPRLLKPKEDDLFPLPLRLLAHYFPQQSLDLLNRLHSELQRCNARGENRDVCVKTLHDGWLLGKKSHTTQRELYAFFDTKVPSVVDLS
uniref:CCZ1/INTU/HSP4 first Longin domain-containing protein n=1 Tax=Globisporangium ultimum (strain ATCC 200006 / CBS 805.95 / DAOM BR144) TaxID=431595 RepID=K3WFD7_GLOUD